MSDASFDLPRHFVAGMSDFAKARVQFSFAIASFVTARKYMDHAATRWEETRGTPDAEVIAPLLDAAHAKMDAALEAIRAAQVSLKQAFEARNE